MKIIVSGALPNNIMQGIKNFAEDTEAVVSYVDEGAAPAIVTVSGGTDSGLAELLGELSKVMRMFGLGK